eukprot:jgi/Tetstr1/442744/TSEL_030833.t1
MPLLDNVTATFAFEGKMSDAKYKADPETGGAASGPPQDLKDMGGLPNPSYQALGWAGLMCGLCGLVIGVVALALVIDLRSKSST